MVDLVGLVINTFNRPEYIQQCYDSLYKSDLSKIDYLVVVDDHSTDLSIPPLLNKLCSLPIKNTKLIIMESNEGIEIALRCGLDYLLHEGCYTLINLDSDAIVKKDWVKKILKLYNTSERNYIISGFNTNRHRKNIELNDMIRKSTAGGINFCFSSSVYLDIVRPALYDHGRWDWKVCEYIKDRQSYFIITKPSVIQHIGAHSSLGHRGGDVAEDFIL